MKSKTFNTLWLMFSFLLAIVLGLLFKIVFEVKSWLSILAFAFTSIVSFFLVHHMLYLIDKIVYFFKENKKFRDEEKIKKEKIEKIEKEMQKHSDGLSSTVRYQLSKKIAIEEDNNKRKESLTEEINWKENYIKELQKEVEQLKELIGGE